MMLLRAAAATVLVLVAGSASAEVATFRVDGEARRAFVYAPPVAVGSKLPVVFAFHGRGDDIENFEHVDLHLAWPEAIVVYFQGLESRGAPGWQVERGQDGDRDLKLVDAALASLRGRYSIDENRIYATGFSNGAAFTFLLWAERPDLFAAYAVVAGRLRPSVQPKQRRPMLHVAGVSDPQVTYPDQRAAIVAAIGINGVRNESARCGDGCTIYGRSTPAPVKALIHQGGHEYPRGTSERIVEFFRDHPRRQ